MSRILRSVPPANALERVPLSAAPCARPACPRPEPVHTLFNFRGAGQAGHQRCRGARAAGLQEGWKISIASQKGGNPRILCSYSVALSALPIRPPRIPKRVPYANEQPWVVYLGHRDEGAVHRHRIRHELLPRVGKIPQNTLGKSKYSKSTPSQVKQGSKKGRV